MRACEYRGATYAPHGCCPRSILLSLHFFAAAFVVTPSSPKETCRCRMSCATQQLLSESLLQLPTSNSVYAVVLTFTYSRDPARASAVSRRGRQHLSSVVSSRSTYASVTCGPITSTLTRHRVCMTLNRGLRRSDVRAHAARSAQSTRPCKSSAECAHPHGVLTAGQRRNTRRVDV